MATIDYGDRVIDSKLFDDLIGEDIIDFIFQHAPKKVSSRVASALNHYIRAIRLSGVDEEMGAIRLIAAEEELVVAIFEWLKLKEEHYATHKDFVRKFKNHVVKLSFYPVLSLFRFVLGDMLRSGITMPGMEELLHWTVKPVVDGNRIRLALLDNEGRELIRHNPLSFEVSQADDQGKKTIALLLSDLTKHVKEQQNTTMKAFLLKRAEYRNKLLYATDAGSAGMGDSLVDLIEHFKQTYHDLLWVLAVLLGNEPPSKNWGVVSQFISLYREVLIDANVLNSDRSVATSSDHPIEDYEAFEFRSISDTERNTNEEQNTAEQ